MAEDKPQGVPAGPGGAGGGQGGAGQPAPAGQPASAGQPGPSGEAAKPAQPAQPAPGQPSAASEAPKPAAGPTGQSMGPAAQPAGPAAQPAGPAGHPAGPVGQPARPAVSQVLGGAKPAATSTAAAATAAASTAIVPAGAIHPEPFAAPSKKSLVDRLASVPVLMALNILLVSFVIGMLMVPKTVHVPAPGISISVVPRETPPVVDKGQADVKPTDLSATSWRDAEAKFAKKKFDQAAVVYDKLIKSAGNRMIDESVLTFFQVRLGQCLKHLNKDKEARILFDEAARSPSPVVRAVARYNLGLQDANEGRHLNARTWAYMALAALGGLEKPSPLEADCDFLVARTLTQKVLPALAHDVHWSPDAETRPAHDPFAGLSDSSLQDLLNQGVLAGAETLAPRITRLGGANGGSRYSASCSQVPLEEFLARFTAETGEDVEWVSVNQQVRTRAVSLNFRDVSANRLAEVACGSVGLVARFDLKKTLLNDPQGYSSVKEENTLLIDEAKSAWRRFFLRHMDDYRVPAGRLAVAVIYEGTDTKDARDSKDPKEAKEAKEAKFNAMQEYELISTQYPRSPSAPQSLLQLAKLRIRIQDYTGATKALTDLIDRYPHGTGVGEGLLGIADVAVQQGQFDNAALQYQKVYWMDISPEMNAMSALGAGRCMYLKKNKEYEKAILWLTKFIQLDRQLDKSRTEKDSAKWRILSASGRQMLGNCYLMTGETVKAIESFIAALLSKPSAELRVDIQLDLAGAYIDAGNFLESAAILKNLDGGELSGEQRFNMILQNARIQRAIYLPDDAISYMRREMSAVEESQRGWLELEMARCCMDMAKLEDGPVGAGRKLEDAVRLLTTALAKLPADQLETQRGACDLAEIYLKLGKAREAIAVAEEFLKSRCESKDLSLRVLRILADAYVLAGEYDKLQAMAAPGTAAMKLFMSGDYSKLPSPAGPTLPATAPAGKEGQ
ncbi:MAG: tetratricopeptide repeat protein [Planctomycetes bacterium]|nr:tetratricopeptide repeat protein [Planctomycetota bacterium]